MSVRWLIERDGLYHWPSGWVAQAAVAQSYQTEIEARASLGALSIANPAGFRHATVVRRTMVIDQATGHWIETNETGLVGAVPTAGFIAPVPDIEDQPADEIAHPADAPQGAGDPAVVDLRERKRRITVTHERAAFARFVADPAGAAWLHRLLTNTHLLNTSYSADSHHTAFQEGERNIGLFVLREVEAACDATMVARVLTRRVDNA